MSISDRLYQCALPDCRRTIEKTQSMCFQHWAVVPEDIRQKVDSAWERFLASRWDDDEKGHKSGEAAEIYREYLAAKNAAIDAVQNRLSPKNTATLGLEFRRDE